MVPETGLEPAHLSAPDPKSGVSANSTTRAEITKIFASMNNQLKDQPIIQKKLLFINKFFVLWRAHQVC